MSETKSPTKGLTRRNFLKTTGAVAGVAAVGGSLTPAMQALAEDQKKEAPQGEEIKRVACCWTCTKCQADAHIRDGRIVKISNLPKGSPQGTHLCLRGHARMRAPYNPNRIKYPMKRVGERGSGEWERISWDEAISTIVEKWKGYRKEFGNQSTAYCWGSGNAAQLGPCSGGGFPGRMANVLEMTNVDYCVDLAGATGMSWVSGGANVNDIEGVKYSDTVVLWGCCVTDAWWQLWRPVVDAREKGTQIIAIDPNYSTSVSKADKWIANRPGSDGLLILALMHYIIKNDLHDKQFLLDHTNAPFLVRSDNGLFLRMSDLGQAPTEGPVDPKTNKPKIIDPEVVWDEDTSSLMAWDKATKPALSSAQSHEGISLKTGFDCVVEGLKDYAPEDTAEMIDISVEDIEYLAKAQVDGRVWNMVGMASQAYKNGSLFGQALVCLNLVTGRMGEPGSTMGSAWRFYTLNAAALSPTGTKCTTVPVLGMSEIMETGKFKGKDWPIKSLYVVSTNPLSSAADFYKVLDWWNKVEFIVVVDMQFTDSASYADIVLPVTHALENEDVRVSGYLPFIGVSERAIEPLHEAKSDSEIVRLITTGLGYGEHFALSDDDFLRERVDESAMSKKVGVTLDRLRKEKDIYVDGPDVSFKGGIFGTANTRANLYCEKVTPRLDWGQDFDPLGYHVPSFFPPHEAWPGTEAIKKHPFILLSERLRTRWHTGEFENEWMLEIAPEPTVKINPLDAKEKGIEEGMYVEVFNDRGHAVVKAALASNIRRGILLYPKGWQINEFKAGAWTELTSAEIDSMAVNTSFMDVVADIRVWQGEV